ncbi:hypothetical protein LTR95_001929, partial [Oleoguttula sp. CCFEE 5521]
MVAVGQWYWKLLKLRIISIVVVAVDLGVSHRESARQAVLRSEQPDYQIGQVGDDIENDFRDTWRRVTEVGDDDPKIFVENIGLPGAAQPRGGMGGRTPHRRLLLIPGHSLYRHGVSKVADGPELGSPTLRRGRLRAGGDDTSQKLGFCVFA